MGDKFDLIKKPPEHQSFYLIPYSSKISANFGANFRLVNSHFNNMIDNFDPVFPPSYLEG